MIVFFCNSIFCSIMTRQDRSYSTRKVLDSQPDLCWSAPKVRPFKDQPNIFCDPGQNCNAEQTVKPAEKNQVDVLQEKR